MTYQDPRDADPLYPEDFDQARPMRTAQHNVDATYRWMHRTNERTRLRLERVLRSFNERNRVTLQEQETRHLAHHSHLGAILVLAAVGGLAVIAAALLLGMGRS